MRTWANEALPICGGARWAVVPARGGSKGVPRKCLRKVGGIPLITRSVRAAVDAACVTDVFVNTDDPEFREIAIAAGAKVPFLRPAELATDTASGVDVVDHFLRHMLDAVGMLPEAIVLLQPTTPFVQAQDIEGAFNLLTDKADAVCSVCESEIQPDWLRRCNADGYVQPVVQLDVPQHTPRQKMPKTYRLNGGVYWIRTEIFVREHTFLPVRTVPYIMPVERSVDIDVEADLRLANWLANGGGT